MNRKIQLLCMMIILSGCGGRLVIESDRVVYKNFHDRLSCVQLRCCYPYNKRVMICNQGTVHGDGFFIRYRFE